MKQTEDNESEEPEDDSQSSDGGAITVKTFVKLQMSVAEMRQNYRDTQFKLQDLEQKLKQMEHLDIEPDDPRDRELL